MGWIKRAEDWLEAMEVRNETSPTYIYNEEGAKEVYEAAKRFPPLVEELLTSQKGITH